MKRLIQVSNSPARHEMAARRGPREPDDATSAAASMNGPLEWVAAIGTMLAAALIAADLGRKATGYGFVLFCAVSVTWIISGLTSGAMPIAAMNAILLLINAWGVWQYLLSRKNREVMERVEPVRQAIEHEVEEEIAHERM